MSYTNYSFYLIEIITFYLTYTRLLPHHTQTNPYLPLIMFLVIYWISVIAHMIMDRTPNMVWGRYKVRQEEFITDVQMIPTVFMNQAILVAIVLLYIKYVGRGYSYYEINFVRTIVELALYYTTYDIVFYYGHRFLHMKGIYERVHKKHHHTKGSIGISGMYMHPFDFLLESVLPFIVAFFIWDGHIVTNLIFASVAAINSPHSHGGYTFSFLPLPNNHYLHHKLYNKNFALGIFDLIHGTNLNQPIELRK